VNGEEEERKSILDFYEGKVKYTLDAVLVMAAEKTASTATQVVEKYGDMLEPAQNRELEEMRDEARALAQVPEEQQRVAWVGAVLQNQSEANVTLRKLLEEQIQARVEAEKDRGEQRNRHRQEMALVFGLAIVGWCRQWLFDIIQRLLGG